MSTGSIAPISAASSGARNPTITVVERPAMALGADGQELFAPGVGGRVPDLTSSSRDPSGTAE